MVTPRTADGEIAVDAIAPLIERFIAAGSKGVYLTGSTGAGFALTIPQRKLVVEEALKVTAGRICVLVHVGGCSLAEAIELTQHAENAGADVISTFAVHSILPHSPFPNPPSVAAVCVRVCVRASLRANKKVR